MCPLKSKCPCGYSCGNSACITLRNEYAEAMTNKGNALYDKQRNNVTKMEQLITINIH